MMKTKPRTRRMFGSVMNQRRFHHPAPSIAAASKMAGLIAVSPASSSSDW